MSGWRPLASTHHLPTQCTDRATSERGGMDVRWKASEICGGTRQRAVCDPQGHLSGTIARAYELMVQSGVSVIGAWRSPYPSGIRGCFQPSSCDAGFESLPRQQTSIQAYKPGDFSSGPPRRNSKRFSVNRVHAVSSWRSQTIVRFFAASIGCPCDCMKSRREAGRQN